MVARGVGDEAYTGRFFIRWFGKGKCSRRGGSGVEQGGDASPCDLPDCEAVDARASLARRVGASVAQSGRVSCLHALSSSGTQGDASVPTPPSTAPAPTRTTNVV